MKNQSYSVHVLEYFNRCDLISNRERERELLVYHFNVV